MNRKKGLALIAGALVLLIGAGMALRYFDSEATAAARKEVAHLQTLATSACRCTREKSEAARNTNLHGS